MFELKTSLFCQWIAVWCLNTFTCDVFMNIYSVNIYGSYLIDWMWLRRDEVGKELLERVLQNRERWLGGSAEGRNIKGEWGQHSQTHPGKSRDTRTEQWPVGMALGMSLSVLHSQVCVGQTEVSWGSGGRDRRVPIFWEVWTRKTGTILDSLTRLWMELRGFFAFAFVFYFKRNFIGCFSWQEVLCYSWLTE